MMICIISLPNQCFNSYAHNDMSMVSLYYILVANTKIQRGIIWSKNSILDGGTNVRLIVGVLVGVFAFVTLCVAICYFCAKRHNVSISISQLKCIPSPLKHINPDSMYPRNNQSCYRYKVFFWYESIYCIGIY